MLSSSPVASRSRGKREGRTPAERVRAARLRANLTQQELADRADKHVNTIANLEDGTTPVLLTARGWRTVEDVARVLNTTGEALGYRLKRPVRTGTLTPEQREVIEEILALPSDDFEAVRRMLREIEAKRQKGRR